MNKNVITNSLMDKILLSESSKYLKDTEKRKIKAELIAFFKKAKLYEYAGKKCFSTENCFDLEDYRLDLKPTIDWEWDTNEIYLFEEIVGTEIKESLTYAIECIESLLIKSYSDNSFCIEASVQLGDPNSINIRIYLFNGSFYADVDIEDYNQPVLRMVINPGGI